MKRYRLLCAIVLLSALFFGVVNYQRSVQEQNALAERSLATFAANPAPWLDMEANSEQRQPVYLGATPRELSLQLVPRENQGMGVQLYQTLRTRGEDQARAIQAALATNRLIAAGEEIYLEGWPVRNDDGQLTWAWAYWGRVESGNWSWLLGSSEAKWLDDKLSADATADPAPFLPVLLDTSNAKEFSQIFDDFLAFDDLYTKPCFADCIWTTPRSGAVLEAWRPTAERENYANALRQQAAAAIPRLARVLPQPARNHGKPTSFLILLTDGRVLWPSTIDWKQELPTVPKAQPTTRQITTWPADFAAALHNDLLVLDGEQQATFPVSGKEMRFTRKNCADPEHQLEHLVTYLEERYQRLQIRTVRDRFTWRGIQQSNLIAKIPGSAPPQHNLPVVMADHIDTAFCEEIFKEKRQRVATTGADDNLIATAALLRAAEILKDRKPRHDIWLLHLTGEEFPADDLGARRFIGRMLQQKQDLKAILILDMIGWRNGEDKVFQVNAGESPASLAVARLALDVAAATTSLSAVLRTRFDARSYLYNTDGLIFSDAGYPVVLFNEHINSQENFTRQGYHDATDTSRQIDFEYASEIAKIAIETAARLAAGD